MANLVENLLPRYENNIQLAANSVSWVQGDADAKEITVPVTPGVKAVIISIHCTAGDAITIKPMNTIPYAGGNSVDTPITSFTFTPNSEPMSKIVEGFPMGTGAKVRLELAAGASVAMTAYVEVRSFE